MTKKNKASKNNRASKTNKANKASKINDTSKASKISKNSNVTHAADSEPSEPGAIFVKAHEQGGHHVREYWRSPNGERIDIASTEASVPVNDATLKLSKKSENHKNEASYAGAQAAALKSALKHGGNDTFESTLKDRPVRDLINDAEKTSASPADSVSAAIDASIGGTSVKKAEPLDHHADNASQAHHIGNLSSDLAEAAAVSPSPDSQLVYKSVNDDVNEILENHPHDSAVLLNVEADKLDTLGDDAEFDEGRLSDTSASYHEAANMIRGAVVGSMLIQNTAGVIQHARSQNESSDESVILDRLASHVRQGDSTKEYARSFLRSYDIESRDSHNPYHAKILNSNVSILENRPVLSVELDDSTVRLRDILTLGNAARDGGFSGIIEAYPANNSNDKHAYYDVTNDRLADYSDAMRCTFLDDLRCSVTNESHNV